MRERLAAIWPFFGIRLTTPRLELRLPLDEDLLELAEVAVAGIHDPDKMPFTYAWTDREPNELRRGSLQYHWNRRAGWRPEAWWLEFAVYFEGRPVGIQGIGAADFSVRRSVESGSWLSRSLQGQGLGKEMRASVLALAFGELGATHAFTEAFEDNPASMGVTRAMGYGDNGIEIQHPRGEPAVIRRFVLTREEWRAKRPIAVRVEGVEPCLELLGAR